MYMRETEPPEARAELEVNKSELEAARLQVTGAVERSGQE
jgi:hypothetical protein